MHGIKEQIRRAIELTVKELGISKMSWFPSSHKDN